MTKLGIKKIEYRPLGSDESAWAQLKNVSLSATLSEEWSEDPAGKISTVTVKCEIRNSNQAGDKILRHLKDRYYQYRVTDMNDKQYIIGNEDYIPVFLFSRTIGSLKVNGYTVNITYKSPDGITPNI
ncbi:MAG: hypothetical protein LBQ28_04650 [Prevotellaceae bacterium]|jgi:hypothetical protein|nr:hypothetical protein [Prevotellaceae bacterium]